MKFYTHQTECTTRKVVRKPIKVRSGAVPHLSKIVEMSHRGVLPETLNFSTISSDGFIPPQYANKSFVELHRDYTNLSNEFNNLAQTNADTPPASDSQSESNPEPPTPQVGTTT